MNSYPEQLLKNLNTAQTTAVTWPHDHALILAGAGSGKTRVLTTRIAWLLQTGQISTHAVLAVTFTNKAAKEMQMRLAASVPFSIKAMWLGTFHGLCHRLLRMHSHDAKLPSTFQILDQADQLASIKRLLKAHNISDTEVTPKSLQYFINSQKEAGLRASALSAPDPHLKKLIELFALYDAQCQKEGVVDFAELLLRSFELLSHNPLLREHYQNRFTHILIDEFQDTSRLQYEWIKLLVGEKAVVFAVGDDDQSIYAFRGANVSNMQSLLNDFHIKHPIKLEENYRSMGNILAAANALIERNPTRLGKNLFTQAGDGEPLRFMFAPTDFAEGEFVLDEAKSLHREGMALSDIAILYRSNAQSRALEHVLFKAGMPYKIYGGLRFFERQEIKHALAYLRLTANPHDDNALLRIINVPARGIGARSIESLQGIAADEDISLWNAACLAAKKSPSAKINTFITLIETLTEDAKTATLPTLIEDIVAKSGLHQMYENDKLGGTDRLDNLAELVSAAAQFNPEETEDENQTPLSAFLTAAALEAGEHQAEAGQDALQLMTIHAAKGLEFDAVFITGLEEGLFPSEYSLAEKGGIEEERRLMYVALTRARKRLYLSAAQMRMLHGKTNFGVVSRFLDEIPTNLIKSLSATTKSSNSYHPSSKVSTKIKETETEYGTFTIGKNVRHPKFGTGVIIEAEGSKDDLRLHINFGQNGIKCLDVRYAKLETIE